jgi:hypothetical protein
MKNILIFIFSIFLLCSCYNNEYIGNDFGNDFDEECYYMIYTNDTLKNHNECQLLMFLVDISNPQNYVSKNENIKINNATIKVNLHHIKGIYKRYMQLYIKDTFNIQITDTIHIIL